MHMFTTGMAVPSIQSYQERWVQNKVVQKQLQSVGLLAHQAGRPLLNETFGTTKRRLGLPGLLMGELAAAVIF